MTRYLKPFSRMLLILTAALFVGACDNPQPASNAVNTDSSSPDRQMNVQVDLPPAAEETEETDENAPVHYSNYPDLFSVGTIDSAAAAVEASESSQANMARSVEEARTQ